MFNFKSQTVLFLKKIDEELVTCIKCLFTLPSPEGPERLILEDSLSKEVTSSASKLFITVILRRVLQKII